MVKVQIFVLFEFCHNINKHELFPNYGKDVFLTPIINKGWCPGLHKNYESIRKTQFHRAMGKRDNH